VPPRGPEGAAQRVSPRGLCIIGGGFVFGCYYDPSRWCVRLPKKACHVMQLTLSLNRQSLVQYTPPRSFLSVSTALHPTQPYPTLLTMYQRLMLQGGEGGVGMSCVW
jgi:hypothetical protein